MRIPLLIHEQNAIAGLTNRWLARLATQVLEAFPGSFAPAAHARTIGNPVRADIAALAAPAQRFAGRESRARLLIFGGSQGAQRLNAMLPDALALLSSRAASAGSPSNRRARSQGNPRGITCRRRLKRKCSPFIDDMAKAYAWADLAVCRAGAMTVAELQAAGLGAIFVPLTDSHRRSPNQECGGHGERRRREDHSGARSYC